VRDGSTGIISVYVNGTLFGTYNDAGNLYRPATNTTPIIFFRDDNVVPCEAKAGCVRYASVTSATMTASQVMTTYTNICNIILPVELSSFKAEKNNSAVNVEWITMSEKNSRNFEVERSTDGVNFEKINEVKSRGYSASKSNYAIKDQFPQRGINYYRLKQNDIDGSYKYSDIRSVTFENETPLFYPNPAEDKIIIENGKATAITVRNMLGEEVFITNRFSGNEIDVSDLLPGTYFVSSGEKIQKLIISR
jgi:hypothetical protein